MFLVYFYCFYVIYGTSFQSSFLGTAPECYYHTTYHGSPIQGAKKRNHLSCNEEYSEYRTQMYA